MSNYFGYLMIMREKWSELYLTSSVTVSFKLWNACEELFVRSSVNICCNLNIKLIFGPVGSAVVTSPEVGVVGRSGAVALVGGAVALAGGDVTLALGDVALAGWDVDLAGGNDAGDVTLAVDDIDDITHP